VEKKSKKEEKKKKKEKEKDEEKEEKEEKSCFEMRGMVPQSVERLATDWTVRGSNTGG